MKAEILRHAEKGFDTCLLSPLSSGPLGSTVSVAPLTTL